MLRGKEFSAFISTLQVRVGSLIQSHFWSEISRSPLCGTALPFVFLVRVKVSQDAPTAGIFHQLHLPTLCEAPVGSPGCSSPLWQLSAPGSKPASHLCYHTVLTPWKMWETGSANSCAQSGFFHGSFLGKETRISLSARQSWYLICQLN